MGFWIFGRGLVVVGGLKNKIKWVLKKEKKKKRKGDKRYKRGFAATMKYVFR